MLSLPTWSPPHEASYREKRRLQSFNWDSRDNQGVECNRNKGPTVRLRPGGKGKSLLPLF